ncbi:tetratricopeptide repeat protein [Thalassotalea montiporae]
MIFTSVLSTKALASESAAMSANISVNTNTNSAVPASSAIKAQLAKIEGSDLSAEQAVMALIAELSGEDRVYAQLKLVGIYRRSAQVEKASALLLDLNQAAAQFSNELQLEVVISGAQLERKKNNYVTAAKMLETKGIPLAGQNAALLARTYQHTGRFYRLDKQHAEAEKYYLLALENYQVLGDELEIARMYGSLGVLYESQDDLVLAAEYQIKAMKLFERIGNAQDQASSYFNLGELFYRSEDYDKSLSFYQQALELDKKLSDTEYIGYDYHRIGSIYMAQHKLDEALDVTQKAIDIFAEGSFHQVLSRSYVQRAQIFDKLNKQEARLASLLLAEKTGQVSNADFQMRSVWHNLGVYHFDHQALTEAEHYVSKSLAISKKLELFKDQLDDNRLLSEIHHQLGQDSLALIHLKAAYELKQQLDSELRIKELEKYKRDINLLKQQVKVAKLEEASKQSELEVVAQKKVTEKVTLLTLGLVVLFLLIFYVLHQRRKLAMISASLYEDALQQKNQLLADVSHELRTPLTALKLQVDALRYNLVDDVELSYQKLSNKITDLSHLIRDIYELAVSDVYGLSINTRQLDISPVLKQWSSEFEQYVTGHELQWHDDIVSEPAWVAIDQDRIKQVLANLINNSVNYTDSYTDKPGRVELKVWQAHGLVHFRVQDTSPSVPESEFVKIFERLYRLEKSRNRATGGSGLGLAICQNVIHAHQGTIEAKQSALGGVAILITLPLVEHSATP